MSIWKTQLADLGIPTLVVSVVNLEYDGTAINQEFEFRDSRLYGMCGHFADGTGACDTASMQLPTGTAEEVLKIIRNLYFFHQARAAIAFRVAAAIL